MDQLPIDQIEPGVLYSLSQARRFAPGRRGCASRITMLDAIRRKELKAHKVRSRWLIWGGDLLAWLEIDQVPVWAGRTPAQQRRHDEEINRELREMGFRV